MRMHSVTSAIDNGFVYPPEKAPWLADYLHERASFPKGRHDDQADSTSQALNWSKHKSKYVNGVQDALMMMAADPRKYGLSVGYNRRDALEEWDRRMGFRRY